MRIADTIREIAKESKLKKAEKVSLRLIAKEIDRLTTKLAMLKDELTCEECEKCLADPVTGVTALCMTCWNAVVKKLRAEIDRLTAENRERKRNEDAAVYYAKSQHQLAITTHKQSIAKIKDKDTAIALLNSMVLVGEMHSDTSRKIVEEALSQ